MAQRLPQIARLQIEARPGPGSRSRWHGNGRATVAVQRNADGDWLFRETGQIRLSQEPAVGRAAGYGNRTLAFRNVLRWNLGDTGIDLAHQRFGADREVGLVRLVADEDHADADLVSARPHPCGADLYHARLYLIPDGFQLQWRVVGPDKDELLIHAYGR